MAADSTIARIIIWLSAAQRAPVQMFVDRFARRYTPAVVILAAIVALAAAVAGGRRIRGAPGPELSRARVAGRRVPARS